MRQTCPHHQVEIQSYSLRFDYLLTEDNERIKATQVVTLSCGCELMESQTMVDCHDDEKRYMVLVDGLTQQPVLYFYDRPFT